MAGQWPAGQDRPTAAPLPKLAPQTSAAATKWPTGLSWREFFERLGNGTLPVVGIPLTRAVAKDR